MVRRTTNLILNLAFSSTSRRYFHHQSLLRSHREWVLGEISTTTDHVDEAAADAFQKLFHQAGVTKIGFLRHGKTGPKPTNGIDFDRLLTEEGRDQAYEAGNSFGKELVPFHHTLLVSPAPRTMETAKIFVQAATGQTTTTTTTTPELLLEEEEDSSSEASSISCELQPVEGLYDGSMQPEGSRLFQKIGYAPLRDYVEDPNDNNIADRDIARQVFGSYSATALDAIRQTLLATTNNNDNSSNNNSATLWVVGHAIYLSSAALGVATILNCKEQDGIETILSANTKEAEGFLIDVPNIKATYLSRPSSSSSSEHGF